MSNSEKQFNYEFNADHWSNHKLNEDEILKDSIRRAMDRVSEIEKRTCSFIRHEKGETKMRWTAITIFYE